jgi:hypothetical protein
VKRRVAAVGLVLLAAGCGGSGSPNSGTHANTVPLKPQAPTVTMTKAAEQRPLSAAERHWFGKLHPWLLRTGGALGRLGAVVDSPAAQQKLQHGDPKLRAAIAPALESLRVCNASFRAVGRAPTPRLLQGAKVITSACRHFAKAAALQQRGIARRDPGKLVESQTEFHQGVSQLNLAEETLLPRTEGRELRAINGPSAKTRIQPRYGAVAIKLTGIGIEVRCWSKADWPKALKDSADFTDEPVAHETIGFVLSGNRANLSPDVCAELDRLAYRHEQPASGAARYRMAEAVLALAHETQHVQGVENEATAECYGMQLTRDTARLLGATKDYANTLADVVLHERYPQEPAGYSSPECRDGGKLDLFPRSALWP